MRRAKKFLDGIVQARLVTFVTFFGSHRFEEAVAQIVNHITKTVHLQRVIASSVQISTECHGEVPDLLLVRAVLAVPTVLCLRTVICDISVGLPVRKPNLKEPRAIEPKNHANVLNEWKGTRITDFQRRVVQRGGSFSLGYWLAVDHDT